MYILHRTGSNLYKYIISTKPNLRLILQLLKRISLATTIIYQLSTPTSVGRSFDSLYNGHKHALVRFMPPFSFDSKLIIIFNNNRGIYYVRYSGRYRVTYNIILILYFFSRLNRRPRRNCLRITSSDLYRIIKIWCDITRCVWI